MIIDNFDSTWKRDTSKSARRIVDGDVYLLGLMRSSDWMLRLLRHSLICIMPVHQRRSIPRDAPRRFLPRSSEIESRRCALYARTSIYVYTGFEFVMQMSFISNHGFQPQLKLFPITCTS